MQRVLTEATRTHLVAQTRSLWAAQVSDPEFLALAQGKEIGHRIASYVDEVTCAHLEDTVTCGFQRDADGAKLSRSMGDIWVADDGRMHPLNVKTGLVGSEARPNIVSLKKVAKALARGHIDSYWLLLVKVDLTGDTPAMQVDLVNLFDYLDYVAFDSGTGQLMLKSAEFLAARAAGTSGTSRTTAQVLDLLFAMLAEADARLIANRARARAQLRDLIDSYDPDRFDQTSLDVA